MCVSNNGQGGIRTAALHAGIIDEMPIDGVLEDEALVARKKYTRRDDGELTTSC